MCIAIYKPEDKLIDRETLERCYNSNPDGAGYMFHKNNQLYVKKGFFEFSDFWKSYKRDQKKECVIHFRIKTHGQINKDNCHPYLVNDKFAFVHNGIISGYSDTDKSDTWLFNEDVIQPFVNKWGNLGLFEDPVKKLIESRIGYSKLIFMDNEGNTKIFNEDKGSWDDGVWYSNGSYKKPVPVVAPPPVSYTPSYAKNYSYDKSWNYKKQRMEIGELVTLSWGHYDRDTKKSYRRGSLWEIVAVNQDYSVDLMNDDGEAAEFIYNIKFSEIELFDSADPVGQWQPKGGWAYESY
jgi:hypothetical protein